MSSCLSPPASHGALSFSGRRWTVPTSITPPQDWLETVLQQRHSDKQGVADFLSPSLRSLPDPGLLRDLDIACERLFAAVQGGEAIVVYGDYDVDGVCSATVVVDFLRQVGATITSYIPDRRKEGYGLHRAAIAEICTTAKVLVTTDCGITATEEIAFARQLGADVIVVDHHTVPETLPPAIACLDPMRPDCNFPFKGLCATGVAFMLVCGLRRLMRDNGFFHQRVEPDVRELLDLVALATVADMVPLLQANRTLVTAGLKQIALGKRLGLKALLQVSAIEPSKVGAFDIAFKLAPRINARGRLSHAGLAVELLLTTDPARATELAAVLDRQNDTRRKIEGEAAAQAIAYVEANGLANAPGIVIENPTWHPGVLGLVASRLVNRFHRPAVVIGEGGKGSGRSIPGLDLYDAMHCGAPHLERFGGHAAAAGLTVCTAGPQIDRFRQSFLAAITNQLGPPPYYGEVHIDLAVDARCLSLTGCASLDQLAPFGQGNPQPILLSRQLRVVSKRTVGAEGDHLKLTVGEQRLDAIGFRLGRYCEALPDTVDIAYTPEPNEFRGRTSLQLRIQDIRASAS